MRVDTHKNVEFNWNTAQQRAFEAAKQAVSQTPVMRYYDLDKEITIECDASSHGLGAALLQNGQPVAYSSHALTDCETRFVQIEKECLAILFARERFDLYLYGREKLQWRWITSLWNRSLKNRCRQPLSVCRK